MLGGGGHLGAAEVGMLHALLERDVRPDLVVGHSRLGPALKRLVFAVGQIEVAAGLLHLHRQLVGEDLILGGQ